MKKSPKRYSGFKRPIFWSFIALLILFLALLVVYSFTSSFLEKRDILDIKDQVVDVQDEFEKITSGWTYDEYCRGYGSDIARNNDISCFIELRNNNEQPNELYDSYMKLLQQANFELIRPTEVVNGLGAPDKSYRLTSLNNPISKNGYCEFADIAYASPEDSGYFLRCIVPSSKFYFERRN